ncbi:class E sortase [Agrococcus carbonis]|uniref:Sortase A n=1 Tax=Agrococcus carbonis TaxID=684552 RepID=A0A1H1PBX0_9MICO|nr:class E sortase [Agrococcus carbonis]SDS08109.1 sortase A [Agrococcus carbonis]
MAGHQGERRRRPRRRATVASVLGELLLTAGVLALGYAGWQLWLSDAVLGAQQQAAGQSFAAELGPDAIAAPDTALRPAASAEPEPEMPAEAAVADRASFAVMYIPRLGQFERVVGEGTSRAVLDSLEQGLAHYSASAMPGQLGNFAVAGHRNGQGGPFTHLDEMRIGDRIYVKTAEAWYVYEFRNHEYVAPTGVGVVEPVPQQPQTPADGRYLTLTTCNPEWSSAGRLIAYATFVGWQPLEDGMPLALAESLGRA